jgi:hypothetical protein
METDLPSLPAKGKSALDPAIGPPLKQVTGTVGLSASTFPHLSYFVTDDPENPARVIGAALLASANESRDASPDLPTRLHPVI